MHALALRAPTDENFIFLIGKGILQCSIAYPDLHQIKRNDTHQSAISGEHPLKEQHARNSKSAAGSKKKCSMPGKAAVDQERMHQVRNRGSKSGIKVVGWNRLQRLEEMQKAGNL
jgi:hypothetical protein